MLPKEKSKPTADFSDKITLIYGPPKIGKSTLASQFPGALMLDTEDGLRSLEAFKVRIYDWDCLLRTIQELRAGHSFQTVVVDTIDMLYYFCEQYIVDKHRGDKVPWEDIGDGAYGRGFREMKKEFISQMNGLKSLGLGLVFISHSTSKDDETTGKERIMPSLADRGREIVEAMCDFIFYCDPTRKLKTKPTQKYIAGDRTGTLPETIPMDVGALLAQFHAPDQGEDAELKARVAVANNIGIARKYLADNNMKYDEPDIDLERATIVELQAHLQAMRRFAKEYNSAKSE